MNVNEYLKEELSDLKSKSLYRELRINEKAQGSTIWIEGREVLNFCSNNYLGLANDPRLVQAAQECLQNQGLGAGASRLVCGSMSMHHQLEQKIAEFKNQEACLFFSTGYMANVGIISSMFDRHDVIFCDRLNHASILDGVKLSGAKLKRYHHCDMDHLEELLKEAKGFKKKAIITDSVFSMDGDIAPLDEIVELAQKYDCLVMIDEAHALGVVGKHGRGLAEHFQVEDKVDIIVGTFSKAIGSFGAYCCGSQELISFLINKARSFIYTTGMPPAIAAASIRAVEIIEEDKELRERLWENAYYTNIELKGLGFDTMYSQSPIIPILVKDADVAVECSKRLFDAGIFISAIRPPTVPQNMARLRLTVMALHTKKQIDYLLDNIQTIGKDLGLI